MEGSPGWSSERLSCGKGGEKEEHWDNCQGCGRMGLNEEVMNGEAEGWKGGEVHGYELDPKQVKTGRKEE